MAAKEHKELANFLKEVHRGIRTDVAKLGATEAWIKHCKNKNVLEAYSKCMERLATTFWTANSVDSNGASSRIQWTAEFCFNYFINNDQLLHQEKEKAIAIKINKTIQIKEEYSRPIKLIDVGSCYNPFKVYDFFDVTAIDLYPANKTVLECDFLGVLIGENTVVTETYVQQLKREYYDVVTFCFLLEYIPTSELRIKACKNAYKILKPGGLLIINTPDSKHVGANSKIMKSWQFTLAYLGFNRIKYEKLKYMHCMAYRKAMCKDTALRWALLQKERNAHTELSMHIPQDFNKVEAEISESTKVNVNPKDFEELPFSDFIELPT